MSGSIVVTRTIALERNRNISAHYVLTNLLCVDPPFQLWDTDNNRNKETVLHLNQEAADLVMKLEAYLIPLILRVTLDIFSIF